MKFYDYSSRLQSCADRLIVNGWMGATRNKSASHQITFLSTTLRCKLSGLFLFTRMNVDVAQLRFYAYTRFKLDIPAKIVHEELSTVYPEQCPTQSTIFRWFSKFREEPSSLEDSQRPGRPRTSRIETNVQAVKEFIEDDPKLSCRELAEIMDIDHMSVFRILTEQLKMRNVCCVWVPHELTEDSKRARIDCTKQIRSTTLEMGLEKTFDCLVSVDETWLNLNARPSKLQNRCWLKEGEPRLQVIRSSIMDKRTMLIVAFTPNKRFSVSATPPKSTIDSDKFIEFVRHTGNKWRSLRTKPIKLSEVVWQMDNARPHTSRATTEFFEQRGIQKLWQSPYSPDYNLCDRFLFSWLKTSQIVNSRALWKLKVQRCSGSGLSMKIP